jgi:nifR3 family TIM-barrel protein
VRKVTRKGGGAAIPLKPRLLARIVRAAVTHAGAVPVTMKFRLGIDEAHETYLDAGRIGEAEGCSAVALHARTAAQLYDGEADWRAIAALKQAVRTIPVLGNGDVWEAEDALRMMRATGCDGVVVGRGCLGRPWLFRELCQAFDGREPDDPPDLGGVVDVALEHARALIAFGGEPGGVQQMRKFVGWYLKSFPGARRALPSLQSASTYAELEAGLRALPREVPFPPAALRARRCKRAGTQKVSLPAGYLAQRALDCELDAAAEGVDAEAISGG